MRNQNGIDVRPGVWVSGVTSRGKAFDGKVLKVDGDIAYLDRGQAVMVDWAHERLGPMTVSKTGRVRQNPVPPSRRASVMRRPARDDIERASRLRESFTGVRTQAGKTVTVPPLPSAVAVIGTVDAIAYTTRREGRLERYQHEFAKKDRPLLCVTPDGTQILLIGGDYDFTERGIVDGSDWKTRAELGRG